MLTDEQIDIYLAPLTPEQATNIRAVRAMILEQNLAWEEEIDEGKWFGGLLVYYVDQRIYAFALGPRSGGFTTLHMMAYYGSAVLNERHGAALKKFASGKSCIKFKDFSQVPQDAIRDIIAYTPTYADIAREMFAARKKK